MWYKLLTHKILLNIKFIILEDVKELHNIC